MNKEVRFNINRVYIIASLKGNHFQAAQDLYNYHIPFEIKQWKEVNTKDEFIATLENIGAETTSQSGPLLHIEAHGIDSQDGLALSNGIELCNGEQVTWEEIRPYLTAISARCGNNLTLVMATCWGMYVLQDLIKSFFDNVTGAKCPFLCFVGPETKASVDDFTEAFPDFYKTLHNSKNIIQAVTAMNKKSSVKFRCDHAYNTFITCIQSFADNQIKTRMERINKNPNEGFDYYCSLYHYTYNKTCDMDAVMSIMQDEQFYVDYLNKVKSDFLHDVDGDGERFPGIAGLDNFEKTVPMVRVS